MKEFRPPLKIDFAAGWSRIALLAVLFFAVRELYAAAGAQPADAAQIDGDRPVHVEIAGLIESHQRPEGGYAAICTGGVYLSQRQSQEKGQAVLELRADKAVVFYRQDENPNRAEDSVLSTKTIPTPQGVYLEGNVILQVDRLDPARFGLDAAQTINDMKMTAQKLYYDFQRQRAIVTDAKLQLPLDTGQTDLSEVTLYVRARRVRMWSLRQFQAQEIRLSNDEFYQPHVWVGADTMKLWRDPQEKKVDPGDKDLGPETAQASRQYRYDLKNVKIGLEELPVFWWPQAAGRTTRPQVPIQSLRVGSSSEFGFGIESTWNMAWLLGVQEPKGVDASFRLDEFTDRGPGGGVDLDYHGQRHFGSITSYIINDTGQDRLGRFESRKDLAIDRPLRGRARWQHRQYLPDDWEGTVEVSYLSDRNFLESWHEREFDTDKEQETLLYFKKKYRNWTVDFLNKFHLNDFDYTMTELPRLGVYGAGQDIFEVFSYQHDGYISRMRERAGDRKVAGFGNIEETSILPGSIAQDDFTFAISRNELSLPLHGPGWNFAPTVIGTYVYDESKFDNFGYSDPRYENGHSSRNSFVQGAAGFRASTQFWHVDNTVKSRVFDLDRLRHVIIPEVSAFWVDSNLEEMPRHDVFHFALRQRWQTMRGPENNKHSSDFLRINTSVTLVTNDEDDAAIPGQFFFTRPEWQLDAPAIANADLANLGLAGREQLNPNRSDHADAEWSWLISETTMFSGAINYNIQDGVISQGHADLIVQRNGKTRYFVGHRYLRYGDPFQDLNGQFLSAGMSYKINRKYSVALTQQYDLERTAAAYYRLTVLRQFPHWVGAFSVGYDATRNGMSFMVSLWPEGFDDFALGSRRFTRLAP